MLFRKYLLSTHFAVVIMMGARSTTDHKTDVIPELLDFTVLGTIGTMMKEELTHRTGRGECLCAVRGQALATLSGVSFGIYLCISKLCASWHIIICWLCILENKNYYSLYHSISYMHAYCLPMLPKWSCHNTGQSCVFYFDIFDYVKWIHRRTMQCSKITLFSYTIFPLKLRVIIICFYVQCLPNLFHSL